MPRRRRAGHHRDSIVLLCLVVGTGCGLHAPKSDLPPITEPPPGRALVFVLYPDSGVPGLDAFPAPLFVEEGRTDRYLASLVPGTHLAVALEPGEYLFTVVGQIPDMMGARVRAGETYHAAIHPHANLGDPFKVGRYGQYLVEPINDPADPRLADWLAASTEIEPGERGGRTSRAHALRLEQMKPIYRPRWAAQETPAVLRVPTPHTLPAE